MIHYCDNNKLFHLQTESTSYILKVSDFGHLLNLYYGERLAHRSNLDVLDHQYQVLLGSTTAYSQQDPRYTLETQKLEVSTNGKGDYRDASLHLTFNSDGSTVSDFLYHSHKILEQKPQPEELPVTHSTEEGDISLIIRLKEAVHDIYLDLHYTCFSESNVISRRIEVHNGSDTDVTLNKVMSFNLDLDLQQAHEVLHLTGKWIAEGDMQREPVSKGLLVLESKRGVSSSQHAPYLALVSQKCDEFQGSCYGFGLLYSGNFKTQLERSPYEQLRMGMGISDFDFNWPLNPGECFSAPEAIMTYSGSGLNGMSRNLHHCVNHHVVQPRWKECPRPVQVNNWEATYFDFDSRKLLTLARKAKKLGIELFVLDDGWFGKRDDDSSSLGDWFDHATKLTGGVERLADKIRQQGLEFGIWVEPEMISPDSQLYKQHPEWAMAVPGRTASLGRNQLVLELSNPEVVDYLYQQLSDLFRRTKASYVKWDHNRNLSDVYAPVQGRDQQHSLYHRYVLGLYRLLFRLQQSFPDILFENCSSGGNRFDLGMSYFMPQTWISDNTDAHARVAIQKGFSYFMPPSTMSAHVSGRPSHQALRQIPIETRFNVAAFANLGYQLDLTNLTKFEQRVVARQVAFYKKHRKLLQFGRYYRLETPQGEGWLVMNSEQSEALMGLFQAQQPCNGELERVRLPMLNAESEYLVQSREQFQNIRQFGSLINEHIPFRIKERGVLHSVVANHVLHPVTAEEYRLFGDQLACFGLPLKSQFLGTELTGSVRFMGDYGSRMYLLQLCQDQSRE